VATKSAHPEDLADEFFRVAHALKRTVNARFQFPDLTVARMRVLALLDAGFPSRMGELSRNLDVAARTMTTTIEGLERDGLVRRIPDPKDGRATIVELTDQGKKRWDEASRDHARVVAEVFQELDDKARESLQETLDLIAKAVSKVDPATNNGA
jgi:DNA-binding MarR family transcriptional regulator